MSVHIETLCLCPVCAAESPAYYKDEKDGVYQHIECAAHGVFSEQVERDPAFFLKMYEQDCDSRMDHLVLPVTYRCNASCRYCYTLSNSGLELPPDRTTDKIVEYALNFSKSTNLIGGEPTVRDDLPEIIRRIKEADGDRILSISTNGQKLEDWNYVKTLKEIGLDFIFFPLNHPDYEVSSKVLNKKFAALDNCQRAGIPIWLQRTVDSLSQIEGLSEAVSRYRKIIFNITLRAVKPYGVKYPDELVHVSDMLRYLKKEDRWFKGSSPFNCHVRLFGKKTKLCSWVNDVGRLDPIDFRYVIANDDLTTFHRGMRTDEVLIKTGGWKKSGRLAGREL